MKPLKMDTLTLTVSAMLVALGVVFSFLRVPLSALTEITFTGLPIAAGGYLFGPRIGFLIGALIDLCGYFIKPMGLFFPGFTISAGLIGMIYGFFLYRKREKGLAGRVLLAHFLKTALISLLLNCFWLSAFYGMSFRAVFLASIPKEALNFPIEAGLIFLLLKTLKTIKQNPVN